MDTVKKFLKLFVVVFGLAIMLFIAILYYGKASSEKMVKQFFTHVANDHADRFYRQIHEGLLVEADAELIQAFLQEIVKDTGTFQGLNMNGMNFSDQLQEGARVQRFSGKFRFEKKELPMVMEFIDGKLMSFELNDIDAAQKALPAFNVFPRSAKAKYEKIAGKFWQNALTGKEKEAYTMFADKFKEELDEKNFIKTFASIREIFGEATKITFRSFTPVKKGGNRFTFLFLCDFKEEKRVPCRLFVELAPFKGYLTGFEMDLPTQE